MKRKTQDALLGLLLLVPFTFFDGLDWRHFIILLVANILVWRTE